MKTAGTRLISFLFLVALLGACSKLSPAKNQPRCFFEGNVSASVRTKTETTKDGLALSLEWDASAPAGVEWVPPAKIRQVEMPFGAPCRDPDKPLAQAGIQARVTGDRSLQILLENTFISSMPRRCPDRRFKVTLTLSPVSYAAECKAMAGDGLPFHNLILDISVPESGPPKINSVEGGSYLER